ncbi:hypothetical protein ACIHFD_00210 [Nonomuraea sp. NPDC051941]|uniref:hypothetical protein n=1 Tax=Nonomuraea sp. NPDC051941 TaxID=3364373 RepID=UPI0037CC1192
MPGVRGEALAVPRMVSRVLTGTLGSPWVLSRVLAGTCGGPGVVSKAMAGTLGVPGVASGVLGEAFVVFGPGVSRGSGRAFGVLAGVIGLRGEASSGPADLGVAQVAGGGDLAGGVVGWRGGARGGRWRGCVGGPLRRCG